MVGGAGGHAARLEQQEGGLAAQTVGAVLPAGRTALGAAVTHLAHGVPPVERGRGLDGPNRKHFPPRASFFDAMI